MEVVLIFAVAVVFGVVSHRMLESAWCQWLDRYESSSQPAFVPRIGSYFIGWPLVATIAVGVTFYCACAPPAGWITPHRHSLAFALTAAASIVILSRVVLRWVLGQVRLCPAIFDCTRLESKAAFCLSVAAYGCLISDRPTIERSGILIAAVGVAVASIVLIFDADSRIRLQLRDKSTASITELILQIAPLTWVYARLTLRWQEGAGALVMKMVLRLGAVIGAATALAVVPSVVSATENLVNPPPPAHVPHGTRTVPKPGIEPPGRGGGGGINATRPTVPPVLPVLPVEYTQVCGSDPANAPGGDSEQTPGWVKTALYNDWLGKGAPGANIAGCPGAVVEVNDGYDDVWYQVGTLNGETTSVGIASARNKGAIFLADGGATQVVQGLLDAGVAASGSERISVRNGDAQFVYDNSGTWLLIRSTLHPTGDESVSTTYTVLPPGAFVPWLDATEDTKAFLWPTFVSGSADLGGTIGLALTPYGESVGTIAFSANGKSSTLEINGGTQTISIDSYAYPVSTVTEYATSSP